MAGRKPVDFNKKANDVLRAEFQKLREQHGWSTKKAGEAVGIKQQAASTILNRGGGFSHGTASRLAQLCGFTGVDEMLAHFGALADVKDAPTETSRGASWSDRDMAARIAVRAYSKDAIDRVIALYTENIYSFQKIRFWMDAFSAMQKTLDEEARVRAEAGAVGQDPAALPRARRAAAAAPSAEHAPMTRPSAVTKRTQRTG